MTDPVTPPRTFGSFHALAARLLRDGYPDPLTDADIQQHADAAVARIRANPGNGRAQPPIDVIRQGTRRLGTHYDLSEADLRGANLRGVKLIEVILFEANLFGAKLSWADLTRANLRGANLHQAYLIGADLTGANLANADLNESHLIGTYLIGANLTRANLGGADLRGADLRGADLRGAWATPARLDEAVWDRSTVWPAGWSTWIADRSEPLPGGGYRITSDQPGADDRAASPVSR
ncbi:pentapeptide repeat-containing protein [Actinoplanes sp. SE50]|uniref:pentapeptide repeat-containing protein n=1 Tax=unclassified Actinoplanes TaxID=2626549 RepID=UPI00023ED611|nr:MULTISPECIES: pentapeptide repeat-containing protein [unclassified Actinoplanes]AEV85021.1 pentapeptide repeat-containing protein [Actinoplanes sp. SE50/110]ATO83412.1 pentapeptide repeat-containing protein [Actinoplanes sp. SE50]SLM00819.1 pentapeptide repeat-containing protein [Actinoplanes sp. SE50/110]